MTPAQAYGHPNFVTDVPIQGPTDEGMRRLACCWTRTRIPQTPACVDCEGPTPMWTRHSLCLGNRLTNSGLGDESIALSGSACCGFSLGLDPGAAGALAALGLPAPGQCATASGYTVAVDPSSGDAAFSSAFGDPTTVVPFAQLAGNLQQGTLQAQQGADLSAWNAAFAALAQAQAQGQAPYSAPVPGAAYAVPGAPPAPAPPDWGDRRPGWERRRWEWERRRREWAQRYGAQPAAPAYAPTFPGSYAHPGFAPRFSHPFQPRPGFAPLHPGLHPAYAARGYGGRASLTAHPEHAAFRTALHPSLHPSVAATHPAFALHPSVAATHAAAASPHAAAVAAGRPASTASIRASASASASSRAAAAAAGHPAAAHPAAASTALVHAGSPHASSGHVHGLQGPSDPDVSAHLAPDQLAWVQHTLATLNERILGSSGSSCPTWADPAVHLPAAVGCFQTWWNGNLAGAGKPGTPLRSDGALDEDTLCALQTVTAMHAADFPHPFPDPGGQFCRAPAPLAHPRGGGLLAHWKGLSTPAKVGVGLFAAAAVGGVAVAVVHRRRGRR